MRRRHRWWLLPVTAGLGVMVALATSIPTPPSRASGPTGYSLYYAFNIPQAVAEVSLSAEGSKNKYAGTLTGTLGGLSVSSAKYSYGAGSSAGLGGGTFSLATPAGAVRDANILMGSDKKGTTLLFFATYLGTRLAFSITGEQEQIGGSRVTATGLAETGFTSHEQYLEAIRAATGSLAPGERDQVIGAADQNPRLVREYQQKHPTQ